MSGPAPTPDRAALMETSEGRGALQGEACCDDCGNPT